MITAAAVATGLPFLAAFLGLAVGGKSPAAARLLATVPLVASAALAIGVAAAHGDGGVTEGGIRLTPAGALDVGLSLRIDGLAALVGAMVAVVALLVQVYSSAYMRKDERYSSYAAMISLFSAAMLLVVYTGDLIVLLVGWEVMGVCSYFLVGHYWETEIARAAAVKAFLVTKLGDVPFLIGILVLGAGTGSFRIGAVVDGVPPAGAGYVTAGAILILGGVAGKSAQVPLHTWLPDAMAGPTPVSALIHAATMVAAGAYAVARLYPVFLASTAALVILAVMAAVTMVFSALAAFAQDDLKRVLAWSTVSQLAYMTGGLAAGGRDAAVFHLLTHGAFKALLFLAAGVVIHLAGSGRISDMGGLREHSPLVFWTTTAGLAALVGVPPLSGFFSKEAVIGAAEHTALDAGPGGPPAAAGWLVLIAALLTAALTAAYATRVWLRVFFGAERSPHGMPEAAAAGAADAEVSRAGGPAPGEVHAALPAAMRWPLAFLAVPTVLLGVIGLSTSWLPSWLGDADGRPYNTAAADAGLLLENRAYYDLVPNPVTSVIAVALIALGAGAVHAAWRRDPSADPASLLGPLRGPAERGFDADRLYGAVVVRPVQVLARAIRFVDDAVVDGSVRGAAEATWRTGGGLRRTQNGNVHVYLAGLLTGIVVLAVAVAVNA